LIFPAARFMKASSESVTSSSALLESLWPTKGGFCLRSTSQFLVTPLSPVTMKRATRLPAFFTRSFSVLTRSLISWKTAHDLRAPPAAAGALEMDAPETAAPSASL
ncbi:hypothetical protein PFISCL1PPCAC_7421, partial [Pristionchus fissidentatus]